MRFYGREKEMGLLELLYKNRSSFIVITGKRRVGKTELIKRFLDGKRGVYLFVDSRKGHDLLLLEFERDLKEQLHIPEYVRFKDFGDLFEYVLKNEDMVLAIDEFQRLYDMDPSIIMTLQRSWDLYGPKSKVLLIVSGSSMGMMNRIFIGERAPLFKRADNILTLKQFEIGEIFEVLEDLGVVSRMDRLDIYTLFGGTIHYYRIMEKYGARTFDECLDRLILDDVAPLRNEVRDILVEEFGKEHHTYYEILNALAMGRCTKREMGDLTQVSSTSLSPYLFNLQELMDLVEYEVPVTERRGKTKKGRYRLKDHFFRFYFRFIYSDGSNYEIGNFDPIRERVKSLWSAHRGRVFEDVCANFLRIELSRSYSTIGRYWDRKGNGIDMVGIDARERKAMLVEVKARTLTQQDIENIIQTSMKRSSALRDYADEFHYGVMSIDITEDSKPIDGYDIWTLDDMLKKQ